MASSIVSRVLKNVSENNFTSDAEAIPTRNLMARTTADVQFHGFIVHYGMPRRLHSDLGANFLSKETDSEQDEKNYVSLNLPSDNEMIDVSDGSEIEDTGDTSVRNSVADDLTGTSSIASYSSVSLRVTNETSSNMDDNPSGKRIGLK
ncbi:hypothetical protein CHS0354_001764 [Potamilus streckersoni]|uniref:Uncharacterized protein n=1 Tax=Potamilus streckersoni TaxID=2493646 RepID=A0AAE0SIH4_9BIVA|nr:hypothetical protein CHS0354_001764 [Potamilus streckersoni]